MSKISAVVLFSVLVLGGPVLCIIKAVTGREQHRSLPERAERMIEEIQ